MNWKNPPHGFIKEKYKKWYLKNCGYFYDKKREKEGYYPWVVDGDEIIETTIKKKIRDKYTKKEIEVDDTVDVVKASIFDEKYDLAKKQLINNYSSLDPINEQIFDYMRNKTTKIGGQDEFVDIDDLPF